MTRNNLSEKNEDFFLSHPIKKNRKYSVDLVGVFEGKKFGERRDRFDFPFFQRENIGSGDKVIIFGQSGGKTNFSFRWMVFFDTITKLVSPRPKRIALWICLLYLAITCSMQTEFFIISTYAFNLSFNRRRKEYLYPQFEYWSYLVSSYVGSATKNLIFLS